MSKPWFLCWGGLYTSQSYPPWPENRIIITFTKLKLSPKTGSILPVNPVLMSERVFLPPGVSSSPTSYGTSLKARHTSQDVLEQLQAWEGRPMRKERQGNMLLAPHWLAVKGFLLFGYPMGMQQIFSMLKLWLWVDDCIISISDVLLYV